MLTLQIANLGKIGLMGCLGDLCSLSARITIGSCSGSLSL